MPTSRLEIDLSAIDRNLGVIRKVVTPPGSKSPEAGRRPSQVGVCAVVKQDGYGLGAVRIAKRLAASGVDMLSVYSLDEARAIAEAIPQTPILVLMPVHGVDRMDPLYRHASGGRLHLTLHNADQFNAVAEMAGRIGAPMPVHVQIDTGLSRGGVLPEDAEVLVDKVLSSPRVKLAGLMTHFASPCCDERYTREQARSFRDFVEAVKPAIRAFFAAQPRNAPQGDVILHAANSCATFRSRSLHGAMVRVGQALLGFTIDDAEDVSGFEFGAEAASLEPCVRWTSSVVHLAEIPPGWPVGYGSTWRAPQRADGKRTRIALIPVGYADGYPRSLSGKHAVVGFTGRPWEKRGAGAADVEDALHRADTPALPTVYAPVIGRVSMDQITVDVTDIPEQYLKPGRSGSEVTGAEVELYSANRAAPNFLPRVAVKAETITHEMLTRSGPRVERAYRYPAQQGAEAVVRTATTVGGATGINAAAR